MENIHDRFTQALDEALELTFLARDPIAVSPIQETDHDDWRGVALARIMTGETPLIDGGIVYR